MVNICLKIEYWSKLYFIFHFHKIWVKCIFKNNYFKLFLFYFIIKLFKKFFKLILYFLFGQLKELKEKYIFRKWIEDLIINGN